MRAKEVAAVIALNILAGTAATAVDRPPVRREEVVRFSRGEQGLIVLPVAINGHGPFKFVLDTGSNRSAISAKLAGTLGLRAAAATALRSATSTTTAIVVRLDAVGVGSVVKCGLLMPVLPSASQAVLGSSIDGLLGQDFLIDETYTIDYERLDLVWHANAAPKGGDARLPLKLDEGRWLVALSPGETGPTVWFVPDSGAAAFVLFDRGLARSPMRYTPAGRAAIATVNDGAEVTAAIIATLHAGSVVFRDQPAVVIQQHRADAPAADGLLPLSAFSRITFDARAGVLAVWK